MKPTSPLDLFTLTGTESPSPMIATVLRALYGLAPQAGDLERWREVSATPWPSQPLRNLLVCAGRRALKTSGIAAPVAVFESLFGGHEEHAAPGARIHAVVVAPEQRHAREALHAVRTLLDALGAVGVRYEARGLGSVPEIVITNPAARCERVITIVTHSEASPRAIAVHTAIREEAGHAPFEGANADRDIDRALRGATVQFPNARHLSIGTPGAPAGLFHECVVKPPKWLTVVRGATWQFNPRITEEMCRHTAGDDRTFEQEFAARQFGFGGETIFSSELVSRCVDLELTRRGPLSDGRYVIGADYAAVGDAAAICVCSVQYKEIAPGHEPIAHVVVDHLEVIQGSREKPLLTTTWVERLTAVSRAYNRAPVRMDSFSAPDIERGLKDRHVPVEVVSMAPQHQTPRWKTLMALVSGQRLHIPPGPLVEQLPRLKASELASGMLKVEGRRDDACDALALGTEAALKLEPTGGDLIAIYAPGFWSHEVGLIGAAKRWLRRLPNGRTIPTEPPEGSEDFEIYAREATDGSRGEVQWTPAIGRWLDRRRAFAAKGDQ